MSATDHHSTRQARRMTRRPPRPGRSSPPKPGCPESLRAVAQVDPSALSGAELVDAIVASEKAMSLLAARQMGLLTEFARPGRAGDVSEIVAELMDKGGQGRGPDGQIDLDTVETLVQERAASLAAAEIAAALQISPITAGSRVRKAQDLCDGLPATVDALASGRIDRGRAWLIAERTAPLTPSLREAVQDRILPIAEDRSAGNLRSLLDRAVIAADPHAAENRERKAKHDRELVLRSLPDGMASRPGQRARRRRHVDLHPRRPARRTDRYRRRPPGRGPACRCLARHRRPTPHPRLRRPHRPPRPPRPHHSNRCNARTSTTGRSTDPDGDPDPTGRIGPRQPRPGAATRSVPGDPDDSAANTTAITRQRRTRQR